MPDLSVNVNKIALLRNSRGQNTPDVLAIARQVVACGAAGITVHPRPDERHITYQDVQELSAWSSDQSAEFNVEGYPSDSFVELVLAARPDQVTLVPDPPGALTSAFGWDVVAQFDLLADVLARFKTEGIRTSLFLDPGEQPIERLCQLAPDRVELYTYDYAHGYSDRDAVIEPYVQLAKQLDDCGIQINAGHDLNLDNLGFFVTSLPSLKEVSIGHALICDALQMGLNDAVRAYLALCDT